MVLINNIINSILYESKLNQLVILFFKKAAIIIYCEFMYVFNCFHHKFQI